MNESPEVDRYLAELSHPLRDVIGEVRLAILAAEPRVTEKVKWNAPSFGLDGTDRVTFRLRPGERFQLIFHRGVKVRDDADGFAFEDSSGVLEWATPDRAVLTLRDADDARSKLTAVVELAVRWMRATAEP